MSDFTVGFLKSSDRKEWRELFEGYALFYKTPMADHIAESVWQWLQNPNHVLEGLIVRDQDGQALGIAHVRACPRPLSGADIGFVDDMFVNPDFRGSGAADAMVSRLVDLAKKRRWSALRWVTQHYNERGRAFYDRYTNGPSDFIMYQLKIDD